MTRGVSRRWWVFGSVGVIIAAAVTVGVVVSGSGDAGSSIDTSSAHEAFTTLEARPESTGDGVDYLGADCPFFDLHSVVRTLPEGAGVDGDYVDLALWSHPEEATSSELFTCARQNERGDVVGVLFGLAEAEELSDVVIQQFPGTDAADFSEREERFGGDLIGVCTTVTSTSCGAAWSDGRIEVVILASGLDREPSVAWVDEVLPMVLDDLQRFDPADVTVRPNPFIVDEQSSTCRIDRRTLETASEAYAAHFGTPPTSQQDLVDTKLILAPSDNYDVAVDGTVILAPGSSCD